MRGSGKFNLQLGLAIHQMIEESMQYGNGLVEVIMGDCGHLEAKAVNWSSLLVQPDDVEKKVYELTDYDPRGADRIKGPKGPRTKWGKLK